MVLQVHLLRHHLGIERHRPLHVPPPHLQPRPSAIFPLRGHHHSPHRPRHVPQPDPGLPPLPPQLAGPSSATIQVLPANGERLRLNDPERRHGHPHPHHPFAGSVDYEGQSRQEDRLGATAVLRDLCCFGRLGEVRIHDRWVDERESQSVQPIVHPSNPHLLTHPPSWCQRETTVGIIAVNAPILRSLFKRKRQQRALPADTATLWPSSTSCGSPAVPKLLLPEVSTTEASTTTSSRTPRTRLVGVRPGPGELERGKVVYKVAATQTEE